MFRMIDQDDHDRQRQKPSHLVYKINLKNVGCFSTFLNASIFPVYAFNNKYLSLYHHLVP